MKQKINKFLEEYDSKFKWAKTYEKFSPHEYLLMWQVKDTQLFKEICSYIEENGYKVLYGKKMVFRCYDYKGYRYWVTTDGKNPILNRAKNEGYEGYPQRISIKRVE